MKNAKRSVIVLACLAVLAASACARRAAPPPRGPLCSLVNVTRLPAESAGIGPGRWSVELPVDGPVLVAHEARSSRLHITPNGEAWAGLLEHCVVLSKEIHLDPEASALHAWVESDASKDRLVAAMCRAVDDRAWLDACLASLDRSTLDD
jgi:hypothetical protein